MATPTTLEGMPHLRIVRIALPSLLVAVLCSCAAPLGGSAPPPGLGFPDEGGFDQETVVRAIDGDTFELSRSGTVRLIGIDSPESVKPGSPVECHGPEAGVAAARLTGKTVRLELDVVAGETDRYGRRLAYLWYLDDGTWHHYNLEAITNGDARAYAFDDQQYLHRAAFEDAERAARERRTGLWDCD